MASAYFYRGSIIESLTSTPSSGGNLALTNAADHYQIITGTQAHTVTMPDATTLVVGIRYEITNASTQEITVNAFGGALLGTIASGSTRIFRATDIGTAAGAWDVSTASAGGGGLSSEETVQFDSLAAKGFTAQSRIVKYNPEEIAGNFWTTKTPVAVARCWPTNFALNGYAYDAFGINNSSTNVTTTDRYDTDLNYFLSRAAGITAANTRAPFVLDKAYVVGGDTLAIVLNAMEAYDDVLNSWASRTAAPGSAFYGASSWALHGYGYVAGGQGSGTTTYIYNSVSNAWHSRSPVPTSTVRTGQGDGAFNGYGHIFGGTAVTTLRRYDPTIDAYSLLASSAIGHAMGGVGYIGGAFVASGGENVGGTPITTVEKFYDATGAWQTVASIGTARYGCGPTMNQLFMHISNGVGTGAAFTTVEAFTPFAMFALGSLKKSVVVPSAIAVAAVLNNLTPNTPVQLRTDGDIWRSFMSGQSPLRTGDVLVNKFAPSSNTIISGGNNGATYHSSQEQFSNDTNAWISRQAMATARASGARFNIDGVGYATIGRTTGSSFIQTGEKYGELLNVWTAIASSGFNKSANSSFVLDGYGYEAFGDAGGGYPGLNTCNRYDSVGNAWISRASGGATSTNNSGGFGLNGFGYCIDSFINISYSLNTSQRYNQALNTWSAGATLTTGGTFTTSTSANGFGWVVGGTPDGGTPATIVQKFNQSLNTYSNAGNLSYGTLIGTVVKTGGFLYVCGGSDTSVALSNASQYNPDSQTSVARTAMGTPRHASYANESSAWRNYELRVAVPALYTGAGALQHVTKASMLFARSGHATALIQGKTYAAGGNGSLATENPETESYDSELNSWTRSTDFPVSTMYSGSYFTLQGKFIRATGGSGLTTAAYAFEPVTKAWSAIGNVNTGRNRMYTGNGKLNGYGYIIGGFNGADVTTIEQYNPSTNAWTLRASITGVQSGGVGTGGAGGYLWRLVGFQNGGGGGASNITEAYNDASNAWFSRTNFPMTSESPATKENSADTLLAMGGYNGSYFSTTYEYSVPLNVYQTKPNMPTAKQAGQFNGVSVTGGSNGGILTEHVMVVNSIKQALLSAGLTVT